MIVQSNVSVVHVPDLTLEERDFSHCPLVTQLLWCRKKNPGAVHGCKKTEMGEKMTEGEFSECTERESL